MQHFGYEVVERRKLIEPRHVVADVSINNFLLDGFEREPIPPLLIDS